MAGDPITAVAEAFNSVFGFAIDPNGYMKLSRDHKLKVINESIKEAINTGNGGVLDALFDQLRELRKETST